MNPVLTTTAGVGTKLAWRSIALLTACSWGWVLQVTPVAGALPDHAPQQESPTGSQTTLSDQIELARLVDLCARRLNLKIEYDATALKGMVTLRLGDSVTDDELWRLTNRVLAARGFTSVQSSEPSGVISILKLTEAPGLAMVQEQNVDGNAAGGAGFLNLVISVNHLSGKAAMEAVKQLLSKPGGSVGDLGGGYLLVADLRPRIEDVLRVLQLIDIPGIQPVVERVAPQFLSATQLAAMITAAGTARDGVTGQPQKGKVIAGPDGTAVILICPPEELQQWRELVTRFDQRQSVVTQSYLPRHFAVSEIAKLVEQTAKEPSPRGSADQWRVVVDELTGTLFITATPSEHEHVAALLERLEAMPPEARRPVRVFAIKNRDVKQIAEVISKLVAAGVLQTSDFDSDAASPFTPRGQTSANQQPPVNVPSTEENTSGVQLPNGNGTSGNDTRLSSSSSLPRPPKSSPSASNQPPLVLTADEGTNTLIATGEPRLLSQLADLIKTLDVRQPQVMLEVLVVSLSDSDALNLGVELQRLEINGDTIIALSSLFGLGSPALIGGSNNNSPRGRGFTGVVLDPGDFSVVIQALQTLNKGRSLSIPKVLVNNNQQATLNSVLQQPFSSTNASTTVATTSFGGTQDAGTTVTVKPQIAEGDHLVLDYSVTLSAFIGQATDPNLPPPRQSNNLTSAVTIPDGYTVVVGGLEIITESNNVSQVPLIGSIPLIGEAFKSRAKGQSRSKFYVFIHCDVMRNGSFEDLKFLSDIDRQSSGMTAAEAGWPEVEPRIIR